MRTCVLVGTAIPLLVSAMAVGGTPMVVKLRLRGAHVPQGVATEVVVPAGWQPGQPALLMVFLHDGWGSEKSFRRHGLASIAQGMMKGGALPPVIIASPRHRGTFVTDSPHGAMESFVAEDLVSALEAKFPGVGGSRERRVIWGISMGGYGTLKVALRHPEVYGRVGALAPWVTPLSWDDYERTRTWFWGRLFEPVFGHTRAESRFESNDLFRIVREAAPERVPPLVVRTGSRDKWEKGAQTLVGEMRGRGIAVDATSIPGAKHRWSDWRRAAPELMRFLAGHSPGN
jgi:S-formylglutathione hydrolase